MTSVISSIFFSARTNNETKHTMLTLRLLLSLCLLLYVFAVVRYYYQVASEPITIIQCDTARFHRGLLQERQPIVCKGVGNIRSVQRFYKDRRDVERHVDDDDNEPDPEYVDQMYASLNVGAWYHTREKPTTHIHDRSNARGRSNPRQSWYDAFMIVQHEGTRHVRLYAPSQTARLGRTCDAATSQRLFCEGDDTAFDPDNEDEEEDAPRFIEVILSDGDALLVPMQWWIADYPTHVSESSHGGETTVAWTELGWRNPFHTLHGVARKFMV